jgi:hypothetical protein
MSLSSVVGDVFEFVGDLFALIVPKQPKPDTSVATPYATYTNTNERPKVGAPFPLGFGCPSITPLLLSRNVQYRNGKQVVLVYLLIAEGKAYNVELLTGKLPLTSLGGVRIQELLPGEMPTMGKVNVWSNPDVSAVELQGGSLDLHPYNCDVTFSGNTLTVTSEDEPFDGVLPRARFSISGTTANAGERVIDTVINSKSVTVTGAPFTSETATDISINQYEVVTGGGSTWAHKVSELVEGLDEESPDDLYLIFDNGDGTYGTVRGGDDTDDTIFAEFRVGDTVQPFRTALNDGADYKVVAIAGREMVLEPAPTTEAQQKCALVLVRRQFGPYPTNPQGTTVTRVGFNFRLPALFRTNSKGKLRTATVGVEIQLQRIDDAGNPIGDIFSLGETSFSGRSRDEQRPDTVWYDVPEGRYQAFVARTTPESDDSGRQDTVYLDEVMGEIVMPAEAPLVDQLCTRMLVEITATSALANDEDGRINGRWQFMHPTYVDGEWTDDLPTADIAPAWAALRRGRGFEVDTEQYEMAHAYWSSRGWEYHAYMTGDITLGDATTDVLAAGDARKWYDWRRNVDSMWLDRAGLPPVLVMHDGNRSRDGLREVPLGLRPEDEPTGVAAGYTDPRTGEQRTVIVGDGSDAKDIQYTGVQKRQQAWELGNRDQNRTQMRRVQTEADLLWLHTALSFGAPVLVQSYKHGWGQFAWLRGKSGLVVAADRGFTWGTSPSAMFVGRDGKPLTAAIPVTQGANSKLMVLSADPGPLQAGEDGGEPVGILFECDDDTAQPALVGGVSPGSGRGGVRATVSVVLDDERVFDDPGPAPDDEYPVEGEPPDLSVAAPTLTATDIAITAEWTMPAAAVAAQIEYRRVGELSWSVLDRLVVGSIAVIPITQGGTYQVRVRVLGTGGAIGVVSLASTVTVVPAPLSVVLDPPTAPPYMSTIGMRSRVITPQIIGGTPPFTGSWVKEAGDVPVQMEYASGPSACLPGVMDPGEMRFGRFHYHVVDSLGETNDSAPITFYFERLEGSGPYAY